MKYIRLTDMDKVNIIKRYSVGLETMIALAKEYGVTRQGVYKVIKKSGIEPMDITWLDVSCTACGEEIKRRRCQVRKAKHLFCSEECYFNWLKHGNGNPLILSRMGQRIARQMVSKYFALQPKCTVHHEDRNDFNNEPYNLKVFANQGDHIRYHRGFIVPILWDGSML